LTKSADVVIVGGGVVGSSIAYHLTDQGCRSVLVLEREAHQGLRSIGKSMGGVRAQLATKVNIQISLYSIPFLAGFEELTGRPSGYRPQGYLFVASSKNHLEYLRANQARQVELGFERAQLQTRHRPAKGTASRPPTTRMGLVDRGIGGAVGVGLALPSSAYAITLSKWQIRHRPAKGTAGRPPTASPLKVE
jgi:glycine/D-amino acid oxidase-like deaminating enzyme